MFPRVRRAWPIPVCLSIATAVSAGIVDWAGLPIIALFAGACLAAARLKLPIPVRILAWATVLVCAVALAAHQLPWINSVLVFDAVIVSPLAAPYTLYWNYDKALAGVLLYAVCVQPQHRVEWRRTIIAIAVAVALTPILVGAPALVAKFVVLDPKWPAILVLWVPANLLVTCLAEEVFFRGLLQRYLAHALRATIPSAGLVALVVCAAVFGIAHIGVSVTYAILATLAGLGYGAVYHATRRVEASILVHFALNLTHLLLFTYPFIAAD